MPLCRYVASVNQALAVVILLERISIAWILKKECLEIEGIQSFALAGNLNTAVKVHFIVLSYEKKHIC